MQKRKQVSHMFQASLDMNSEAQVKVLKIPDVIIPFPRACAILPAPMNPILAFDNSIVFCFPFVDSQKWDNECNRRVFLPFLFDNFETSGRTFDCRWCRQPKSERLHDQ